MRLIPLLALVLALPAYAADGDSNGACRTKGVWRMCEVKLCDARDMTDGVGEPADCTEFDLESLAEGVPDHIVFDITQDNCTNVNVVDVSGVASTGGQKHVIKDGLTLTATGGSYTHVQPTHRFVQVTGSTDGTEGSAGSCNAFTVLGRMWYRLR